MNKIQEKFQQLKKGKRIAFMPFLVAGDPDFETSFLIVKHVVKFADLLEIGFPYSDPLADGPTIQAADQRALGAGMNTDKVFRWIKRVRRHSNVPLTVLVYANIVFQRGIERFYRDAEKAGVQGVLVPDLPIEEAMPYVRAAKKVGICPIFLVTQTTSNQRLKKVLQYAQGYLYVVSVLGVTGSRNYIALETLTLLKRVKSQTTLPVAVGFGISDQRHVRQLQKSGADGFIIGSALIEIIEKNIGKNREQLLQELEGYMATLLC